MNLTPIRGRTSNYPNRSTIENGYYPLELRNESRLTNKHSPFIDRSYQ